MAESDLARPSDDWRYGGFGVYVHWPFCESKCPYCDFNSHVRREIDQRRWARALSTELEAMRARTGSRPVDTVFFGGGTPSLMAPETVSEVLSAIDRLWGMAANAEVTLEANPTSAEAGRFQGYADAGVNRVSIGVQALNDADLTALGRRHTAAEARAAYDLARRAFARVSFDLIYARMGQTADAWRRELDEALGMAVDHLSLYQLTIEPETRFAELHARGKLLTPTDDVAADLYAETQARCDRDGMTAYEVSNHARPGAESRHNLIYWRYGDYVGVGPGAHSRATDRNGGRWALDTLRSPEAWLDRVEALGDAVDQAHVIQAQDQAVEMALMGLRLSEGISRARYRDLAGAALPQDRLAALADDGLLSVDGDRVRTTSSGRLVLNAVLGSLLS